MRIRLITGIVCTAAALFANGGPGPSTGTAGSTARQVALHIPNEIVPPGGMAQMKFMVTEPTPISTGGPRIAFDPLMFTSVEGIELFCPTGDLNGVAVVSGSQVRIQYTTTAGAQGTDYPIMTMALRVRSDAVPGTQTSFQLDPSSTWMLGALGSSTMKPTPPATVTVGGSISIKNVVPGGGILPAGTVVSIRGIGFQPKTQVQLNAIKFSSIQLVGPEEIQFTLAESTNMTGQKIQVVNPDGSRDTYFSYLRGVPLSRSNYPPLANVVPIFSSVTHTGAVFSSMGFDVNTQFTGLAVQNPGLTPADVTVALYSPANVLLGTSTVTLPSGYRLMQETSEWAQGVAPVFGSYAVVTATQPIQVFGFTGDSRSDAIFPLAPVQVQ
jgi:hypothetical protein